MRDFAKKIGLLLLGICLVMQASFANGIAVPGKTSSQIYEVLNHDEAEIIDPMKDQKDTWRK